MSAALLLSRADVDRLHTPDACIVGVEDAFRALVLGKVAAPGILGLLRLHRLVRRRSVRLRRGSRARSRYSDSLGGGLRVCAP